MKTAIEKTVKILDHVYIPTETINPETLLRVYPLGNYPIDTAVYKETHKILKETDPYIEYDHAFLVKVNSRLYVLVNIGIDKEPNDIWEEIKIVDRLAYRLDAKYLDRPATKKLKYIMRYFKTY